MEFVTKALADALQKMGMGIMEDYAATIDTQTIRMRYTFPYEKEREKTDEPKQRAKTTLQRNGRRACR